MKNVALPSGNYISLFAGAGGLDLALRIIGGTRTACYVEINVEVAEVLVARIKEGSLDDAPIWSNATTFPTELYRGKISGCVAGWPCPPVSVAGKRKGTDDARWLWPQVVRVLRETEAQWFVGENVAGLLSANNGGACSDVLRDLAQLGFNVEWMCLRASDVGASHARNRVWLYARRLGHAQQSRENAFAAPGGSRDATGESGGQVEYPDRQSGDIQQRIHGPEPDRTKCDMADTDCAGREECKHCGELREESSQGLDDRPQRPYSQLGYADLAGLEGRSIAGSEGGQRRQWAGVASGAELANAESGVRRADGRSSEGSVENGGRETESWNVREGLRQPINRGRPATDCAELADTENDGRSERERSDPVRRNVLPPEQGMERGSEGWTGEPERCRRDDRGEELADTRCERDERRGPGELGGEGEAIEGQAQEWEWGRDAAGYRLPLFAPGPSDSIWPAILRDYPWLAPAISEEETRRCVCLLAPGNACGLDGNRTDQLRSLGNLACPLQASVAITVLARRLAEGVNNERQSLHNHGSAEPDMQQGPSDPGQRGDGYRR